MTFRRKCDVHLFLNCSGGASLLSVFVLLQNWQMQCTILLNRVDQTIISVWLVHSLTSSPKISCEPHLLILFQLFYVALVDKREVGSQFWLFFSLPSIATSVVMKQSADVLFGRVHETSRSIPIQRAPRSSLMDLRCAFFFLSVHVGTKFKQFHAAIIRKSGYV